MDDRAVQTSRKPRPWVWCLVSCLLLQQMAGCSAFRPLHGIKVRHLPPQFRGESRSNRETIDLRQLTAPDPGEHFVDSGDVLAIYVEGVLGRRDEVPPVYLPQQASDGYPTLGYPIPVRDDGTISLPLITPINVRGMTLRQVEDRLKYAYTVEKQHLAPGQQRVLVSLQRARQYQVLVIRQEQQNPSEISFNGQGSINLGAVKRGMGEIVLLPAYQNDVLHALARTGGLPGLDAQNAVYVLRSPRGRPLVPFPPGFGIPPAFGTPTGAVTPQPGSARNLQKVTGLPETPSPIQLVAGSIPSPDPFQPRYLPESAPAGRGMTEGIEHPGNSSSTASRKRQKWVTPPGSTRDASTQTVAASIRQQNTIDASDDEPETLPSPIPRAQPFPAHPPLTESVPGAPRPGFTPPRDPGVPVGPSFRVQQEQRLPFPSRLPGQALPQLPPGGPQGMLPPGQLPPGQVPGQLPPPAYVPPELQPYMSEGAEVLRIPIRLAPGEMPWITPQDVQLYDGDIVFIESRETEVFYTGGLLGGGQFVLPRDYDLDVLAAISIASGRQASASGAGIGNRVGGIASLNQDITVSASNVIILRPLADGGQVPIKVDLNRALRDPAERIIIQPGDYIILRYKPMEAIGAIIERNLLAGSLIGLATAMNGGGGGG